MSQNQGLRTVYLSNNKISDQGAVDLANAFRNKKAFEELDVQGNLIARRGAAALIDSLGLRVSFGQGHTPMTPREARFFERTFERAMQARGKGGCSNSTQAARGGGGCARRWPSCALLQAAGLATPPPVSSPRRRRRGKQLAHAFNCSELLGHLTADGISLGSSDDLISFLQDDPLGVLVFAHARRSNVLPGDEDEDEDRDDQFAPREERTADSRPSALNQASPRSEEEEALSLHTACFSFQRFPRDLPMKRMFWFPKLEASYASRTSCVDPSADELLRRILAVQGQEECSASFAAKAPSFGFGSMVSAWVKPLTFQLERNASFLSPALGAFAEKDDWGGGGGGSQTQRCELDSLACFFEPLSKCDTLLLHSAQSRSASTYGRPEIQAALSLFSSHKQGNDERGYPLSVPERFRHKGHFWWCSQLLSFLLHRTPSAYLSSVLEEAKRAAQWGEKVERPLLSLHVRRGDSCLPEQQGLTHRRCLALAAYMRSGVLPMARRYGIKTIFLATDDDDTLQATQDWPQFTWISVPNHDRGAVKKHVLWDNLLRRRDFDAFGEASQVLTDLLLLAEGDAFVGKFTSNVDRLAFALLAARKRGLAPYASLDSTWCMDWGQPAGVGSHGRFQC